jgi:manganese efflux pump family protein
VLKLFLFVIPLGLDTFAVAAALGFAGLPRQQRLRVSLLMSGFETAMPIVGLLAGRGLGHAIGGSANYVAIALLAVLGVWMLVGNDREEARGVQLGCGRGLFAVLALGVSISLDELAMGFTIGLLHLSLRLAVVLIGCQAFLLAQLGLRVGARLAGNVREGVERLAGLALLGLALLFLVEKL